MDQSHRDCAPHSSPDPGPQSTTTPAGTTAQPASCSRGRYGRIIRSRKLGRALLVTGLVVVGLLGLMGASGFILFTNAPVDRLQRADAVVVLGGEHDGREDYGISLAHEGWAPNVVLSDPYPITDPVMRRACAQSGGGVEVLCVRPSLLTTRGEAEMVHGLATQHSWSKILVVTWSYHLPRARLVFRECFSPDPDDVVMLGVPRLYTFSPAHWEFIYAYQFAAFAKAVVLGDCQ
jgi:uncharacterized SAM-binding protein YcdF (DUF218 family)